MATKRANAATTASSGPPTLPKTQVPVEHLQILLQRFESLLSSIVGLKEELAIIPGVDEWPALLHRYTNLLSHAYSLSSSLISASPHFLPSQLASFNKILEAEAKNSNLYAEKLESSALFGGVAGGGSGSDDEVKATADGLPELRFYDTKNPLPSLLAHPVLPIMEDRINFLGALLRTAPEPDIQEDEDRLVANYDRDHGATRAPGATVVVSQPSGEDIEIQLEDVREEISRHDVLALRALRTWYHIQQAPDEDGNVFHFKERLPREDDEEEEVEENQDEEDEDEDEEMDQEEETIRKSRAERRHRKKMEASTWPADRVSAFLNGSLLEA